MHKIFKIEFGKFSLYREKAKPTPQPKSKTPPAGDTYTNCVFGQTINNEQMQARAPREIDFTALVGHVEAQTGLNPELIERILTVASAWLGNK